MEEKKVFTFSDFINHLKLTYKHSNGSKKYLIGIIIANLILVTISILSPLLSARKIVTLTEGDFHNLLIIIIFVFVMEITRNVSHYVFTHNWNKYFFQVKKNLQIELTSETLKITTDELNTHSSGVFIERINKDTDDLADSIVYLFDNLTFIIADIGILIGLFFINKFVFVLYIIYLILITFAQKKMTDKFTRKRKIYYESREKVNGFTSEMVRGAKDIKILNAEKSFLNYASKVMEEERKTGLDALLQRGRGRVLIGSIRDVLDLCLSLLCLYFIIKGNLTIASALIIINYSSSISNLFYIIEDIEHRISSFNLSADRLFGIVVGNEFKKEEFGTKKIKDIKGNIRFENVYFSYENEQEVLKNMSFTIEENKTVAFVGKSGAGKSTIFNLISKLYDVNAGAIYLDDININELDKTSIRGNLSIISQNPYIYNMSIKDNLKIIKNNTTMDEIKDACRMACLDEFIESLPKKYDTVVGEGGITLSGGQKQRLAIARAFLLKTKIILFDEATSSLDNETQEEITKAIANMKGEYTVIIIAHRLSTVMNADKIFVVENGRIIDEGNKNYLLKNSRVFKRLYHNELESGE